MKERNSAFKVINVIVPITCALVSVACMKEFLDVKRDKSQVVPQSLEDFRSIFEDNVMNYTSPHLLGVIGSDDYYVFEQQWNALTDPVQKNAYIWADDIYQGEGGDDWNNGYEKILYANFVLEGASDIRETSLNKSLRDEVIGAAHFFRGTNFFLLAQLFCKQYDAATAETDLGLPLRTTSNINVQFQRATLAQTYERIFEDLQKAAALLPHQVAFNTRPSRAAALGMLANVSLQIGDYANARNYSDTALGLNAQLLDYNDVNTSVGLPFPQYGRSNIEIIFYSHMGSATILSNTRLSVDSSLYDTYEESDLRKQAFFVENEDRVAFKGRYSGSNSFLFSGLTTAELLLIRAECNARLGNPDGAMSDLNRLLSFRFTPEGFEPIKRDIDPEELLGLVLSERRKELVYRGRRWGDLKRFAKDPNLAKPLKRILGEQVYTLPIDSRLWVWPIPPDAVRIGNLKQNER